MADQRDTSRQGTSTPSLLNATSEELISGLSDYRFTSADLVVVRLAQLLDGHLTLNSSQGLLKAHRGCE
jgi:hypothetical protein